MLRRNTPTKQAVLDTIMHSGKALSQDEIVKRITKSIDKVTIYRVLNRFCEDGVLHKIVADNGKQYFALCINCEEKKINPNHFHFRCTKCDTIECLNEEVFFSLPEGYDITSVNCVLTGTCNSCKV